MPLPAALLQPCTEEYQGLREWMMSVDYVSLSIISYLCGKEALYMESLTEDQIASDLRGVLEKFLKKHIPLPTKVVRSRWGNSKNTRGSYCYIKVGATVGDVDTLAQPICDNNGKPLLQFAGEATHSSFYSTTHGALLTGHREAKRILDLYGIANSK
ncbi:hypothetical protein DPMN_059813 [Dreissena polymorpha]|uniref:Amine oxidase domain-containing protein n=1 Tax=Dreissena polymorpha TaxID=45954 RepID=A0A9D4HGZ3_DREPO|nr:hypothetical protein DPMN_059813 [Dreissena polymorpha]